LLDLPIGGMTIPKEEIKKAPLLKIEVCYIVLMRILGSRRLCCSQKYYPRD